MGYKFNERLIYERTNGNLSPEIGNARYLRGKTKSIICNYIIRINNIKEGDFINAVNTLIKRKYRFSLSGERIKYEFTGKELLPDTVISPLFETIKANRSAAISYIRSLFTVSVNLLSAKQTGKYVLTVTSADEKIIHSRTIISDCGDGFADFINRNIVANPRFEPIRAVYYRETGIFNFHCADRSNLENFTLEASDLVGYELPDMIPGFSKIVDTIESDCPW